MWYIQRICILIHKYHGKYKTNIQWTSCKLVDTIALMCDLYSSLCLIALATKIDKYHEACKT